MPCSASSRVFQPIESGSQGICFCSSGLGSQLQDWASAPFQVVHVWYLMYCALCVVISFLLRLYYLLYFVFTLCLVYSRASKVWEVLPQGLSPEECIPLVVEPVLDRFLVTQACELGWHFAYLKAYVSLAI